MRTIDTVIIHCSDSPQGRGDNAVTIDRWHKERGFKRKFKGVEYHIGYHYVIVEDGFVEVGRPLEISGAHAKGYNKKSIGICLIGIDSFTEAQLQSLEYLVKGLMEQFNIPLENVLGHYQVDTHGKTCPNIDIDKLKNSW